MHHTSGINITPKIPISPEVPKSTSYQRMSFFEKVLHSPVSLSPSHFPETQRMLGQKAIFMCLMIITKEIMYGVWVSSFVSA